MLYVYKSLDLFLFTETWLSPNINNPNFCSLWYNIIHNDRLIFLKIFKVN